MNKDTHLIIPCDVGEVSDGYHTFNELYEHRHLLFLNFLNNHKEFAFKTEYHDDGSNYEGWFIVGINTIYGQITYHLPMRLWDLARNIKTLPKMPFFDKHTSNDVLTRLSLVIKTLDKDVFLDPNDDSRFKNIQN